MFHELLNNSNIPPLDPGILQSNAIRDFPFLLQKSHLKRRNPLDPIPSSAEIVYVIIGIATYSRDELNLLDKVESSHSDWEKLCKISVFDLMECKSMSDVQNFAPGISMVLQTPVVAVWLGGKLIDSQTGHFMTRQALQKIGIPV